MQWTFTLGLDIFEIICLMWHLWLLVRVCAFDISLHQFLNPEETRDVLPWELDKNNKKGILIFEQGHKNVTVGTLLYFTDFKKFNDIILSSSFII